jgi:hypothetical protein
MKRRLDESEDMGLLKVIVVVYSLLAIFGGGGAYISHLIKKTPEPPVVSAVAPIEASHSE